MPWTTTDLDAYSVVWKIVYEAIEDDAQSGRKQPLVDSIFRALDRAGYDIVKRTE